MKNLVFGIAVGLIAGYVVRRMEERGQLDCICDAVSDWTDKTKKKIKNVIDVGVNEAEYVKDRVENAMDKVADE